MTIIAMYSNRSPRNFVSLFIDDKSWSDWNTVQDSGRPYGPGVKRMTTPDDDTDPNGPAAARAA